MPLNHEWGAASLRPFEASDAEFLPANLRYWSPMGMAERRSSEEWVPNPLPLEGILFPANCDDIGRMFAPEISQRADRLALV